MISLCWQQTQNLLLWWSNHFSFHLKALYSYTRHYIYLCKFYVFFHVDNVYEPFPFYSAGQSMKRKFLLIVSGNYFSIALVNQYKLRCGSRLTSHFLLFFLELLSPLTVMRPFSNCLVSCMFFTPSCGFELTYSNRWPYRRGEKTRKNLMLTVSGKTSCHSHCWLEDVIQLILPGLTGGNSGYAGEGDPFCPLSSLSIRSHKNGLLIFSLLRNRKSLSFFVTDKPVKNSHSSWHRHGRLDLMHVDIIFMGMKIIYDRVCLQSDVKMLELPILDIG